VFTERLVEVVMEKRHALVDPNDPSAFAAVNRYVVNVFEDPEHAVERKAVDAPLMRRDRLQRPLVLDNVDPLDVRGKRGGHPGEARGLKFGCDEPARLIRCLKAAIDILRAQSHGAVVEAHEGEPTSALAGRSPA